MDGTADSVHLATPRKRKGSLQAPDTRNSDPRRTRRTIPLPTHVRPRTPPPPELGTAAPDSPARGFSDPGAHPRGAHRHGAPPPPGSPARSSSGRAAGPVHRTWLGARRTRPGARRSGSAPAAAARAARAPAVRAGRVRAPAPCAPRTARSPRPGSRLRSPSSPSASSRCRSRPPALRPLSPGAARPPVPPDAPRRRGAASRPPTRNSIPWPQPQPQPPAPTAPARDSPGRRGRRSAS